MVFKTVREIAQLNGDDIAVPILVSNSRTYVVTSLDSQEDIQYFLRSASNRSQERNTHGRWISVRQVGYKYHFMRVRGRSKITLDWKM